jgi:hypothetical protein
VSTWTPKEFAAHLATTGQRIHPQMTRTVNKAAMNIQSDWRKRAISLNPPGSASHKYPATIVKSRGVFTPGNYEISIGPASRGQGKLGVILEYGGPHNAPQRSNVAAANAEAPVLAKWLAKLAAEAI